MNDSECSGAKDLTTLETSDDECPGSQQTTETPQSRPSQITEGRSIINYPAPETDSSNYISFAMNLCMVIVSFALFAASVAIQIRITSPDQSGPSLQSHIPSDGPQTVYQNGAPPVPFFPEESHVADCYDGRLGTAFSRMNKVGIVFVMYYSHWSRACRLASEEFSAAAGMMRQVPFVAINCWYSNSECRIQYKFHNYPVFYVYLAGIEKGFHYNGAPNRRYMARFVSSLMDPLTHIHNASHFLSFISDFDSSMLGYFHLGYNGSVPIHPHYQQFYFASLRSIEEDFLQPVRFGVVSDQDVARHLSLREHNDMVLIRTTQANLEYPETNNYTSSAITKWVNENKQQPLVPWLQLENHKSEDFHEYLYDRPALLIFTPLDACASTNADVNLMREVALEYHSCSIQLSNDSSLTTKIKTHLDILSQQRLVSSGNSACLSCPGGNSRTLPICQTNDNLHICQINCPKVHLEPCNTSTIMKNTQSIIRLRCSSLSSPFSYFTPSLNQMCCFTIGCQRKFTDPYVYNHRNCSYIPLLEPESVSHSSACQSRGKPMTNQPPADLCRLTEKNQTLVFLAIDSLSYPHMMLKLGVDRCDSVPSVALLSLEEETHYVMNQPYSKLHLRQFIDDYYGHEIKRSIVSQGAKNTTAPEDLVRNIGNQELYSLHGETQASLVYFYTSWCLACRTTHHMISTAALLLQNVELDVKFYKLDLSQEMVDWKYQPGEIPAVVIFSGGEAHSMSNEITVENLLRFVLRYSQRPNLLTAISQHSLTIPSTSGSRLYKTLKYNINHLRHQIDSLGKLAGGALTTAELKSILDNSLSRQKLKLRYLNRILRMTRSRALWKRSEMHRRIDSGWKRHPYVNPPVI